MGSGSGSGAAAASLLRPIVVCGPSGVGKGTLLKRLFDEFPSKFGYSISRRPVGRTLGGCTPVGRRAGFTHAARRGGLTAAGARRADTTRKPRPGETHGKEYYFTTREELERDRDAGKFIETAEFSGNYYGTSVAAVKSVADQGKICILEIDVQGAQSVAKTDLNARFVFIKPPTWEELEKRLTGRGTESADAVAKRLQTARTELAFLESSNLFECVIVNDDIDRAYAELKHFIGGLGA